MIGLGTLTLLFTLATGGPTVRVVAQPVLSLQNGFDLEAAPVAPRALGDEAPTVEARQVLDPVRGNILELRNAVSGGYFSVDLWKAQPGLPFPTHLAFDYLADPDLKVNLIARVRFQDYELGFTAPPADTGQSIWLGSLAGVTADGAWHHLEVPLLKLLRQQVTDRDLQLAALRLEVNRQDDYLLAGFGGNRLGTRLFLDNFYLGRPGGPSAELRLELPEGGTATGYAVTVDRAPLTQPAARVTQTAPTISLAGLADGVHYVHVKARSAAGWGPVIHHRIEVDRQPPRAGAFEPADGAAACPERWQCRLVDDGLGVSPATVAVRLGDREFGVGHPALSFDPVGGAVQLDLTQTGLTFAEGGRVTVQVTAADEDGQAMAAPASASFVFRAALDRSPPRDPQLWLVDPATGEAELLPGEGTFEAGLDQWQPFGSDTVVERSQETRAAGQYALKLRCTANGSAFSAYARLTPFDAARYRLVSFDYRVPSRLRVDFMVNFHGSWHRIQFTDRDPGDDSLLGRIPDIVQDDEWHHAEFDLYAMLRARFPNETDYQVTNLLLSGGPWSNDRRRLAGNYAGTVYYLDNFHLVPMLNADSRLRWTGRDMVGVTAAEITTAAEASSLPQPDAAAGSRHEGQEVAVEQLAQGRVTLQARLLDAAGNRSRPVTARLLVDAGRPVIGRVWPADGAEAAPATIGLELADRDGAGLDFTSLRLRVAGEEYTLAHSALHYDEAAEQLVWDGRKANPPVRFADGQPVEVALLAAQDLAGNRPLTLPHWRFTMRYAADQTGPAVSVSSRTHPAAWFESFDQGTGRWTATDGSVATRPDQAATGEVLAITPAQAGPPVTAWANLPTPFAAFQYGTVAFRYRLAAGTSAALLVRARNRSREQVITAVPLAGPAPDLPRLAEPEPLQADGEWHTALLPLASWFNRATDYTVPYAVDNLGFRVASATAGAGLEVDSLIVCRRATGSFARLEWNALDETGIQGYSHVIDTDPETIPEPRVMTAETTLALPAVPPGVAWFHLRALDGAGNWSAPVHFLLLSPEAEG